MSHDDPTLGGLPAPGKPVFYPKVGHCIYRGVTEDRAAPGKQLVELEDLEEGSRILIPTERVPKLGLRPAGRSLDEIQEELSSEFEQPSEDGSDLDVEELVIEGSPRSLAKGLKRLHLARQTTGLSREEEQTRRKIRSWLAAEVALSKDCTRAEAQALITRILQEAMNAHRRKEREEAKERRRQVKAQKAAEDAAMKEAEEAETEAMRQALFAGVDRATDDQPGDQPTGDAAEETVSENAEPPATPEASPPPDADETAAQDSTAPDLAEPTVTDSTAPSEPEPEPANESVSSAASSKEDSQEETEDASEAESRETSAREYDESREGSSSVEAGNDSQSGDPNRAGSS